MSPLAMSVTVASTEAAAAVAASRSTPCAVSELSGGGSQSTMFLLLLLMPAEPCEEVALPTSSKFSMRCRLSLTSPCWLFLLDLNQSETQTESGHTTGFSKRSQSWALTHILKAFLSLTSSTDSSDWRRGLVLKHVKISAPRCVT